MQLGGVGALGAVPRARGPAAALVVAGRVRVVRGAQVQRAPLPLPRGAARTLPAPAVLHARHAQRRRELRLQRHTQGLLLPVSGRGHQLPQDQDGEVQHHGDVDLSRHHIPQLCQILTFVLHRYRRARPEPNTLVVW